MQGFYMGKLKYKKYKKSEIIEPKSFIEYYAKNSDIKVVKSTELETTYEYVDDDSVLVYGERVFKLDKPDKKGHTVGYIAVSNDKFVRVIHRSLFGKAVLCAALLVLVLQGGYMLNNVNGFITPEGKPVLELLPIADSKAGSEIKLNTESGSTGSNEFTGYSEAWVNEENQTLPFVNAATNTAYAKYLIYDGDVLIHETDLIAPDSYVDWNAFTCLETKGFHRLKQSCVFYEPTYRDDGSIEGFVKCSVAVTNPSFEVEVR